MGLAENIETNRSRQESLDLDKVTKHDWTKLKEQKVEHFGPRVRDWLEQVPTTIENFQYKVEEIIDDDESLRILEASAMCTLTGMWDLKRKREEDLDDSAGA